MTVLVKLLSQFSPSNDGAFFFWILAIFGLLAFSLAIERLLTVNIKSNIDAEKFSSDVRAMIQKGDLKNAHELAKANSEKALAYVYSRALQVAVGMEYIDYRNIQNAVDEATLEIMPRLTKRTSWLQTFANVATLIGLMGTIYGLILSFEALAEVGKPIAVADPSVPAPVVLAERRDLFQRPLLPRELIGVDAVVFDPPRAGAAAQAEQLAKSKVKRLVAVSCNPGTLARDLRILVDGGYEIARVVPVDQFLFSSHVEVVAYLTR